MASRIPALIKPELLVWARESAKLSLEDAAGKSNVSEELLSAWEKGESQPSIPQLRKLGEAYKRPIAVFFLSEAPQGFAVLKESRRLPGIKRGAESPELVQALRVALYRREAAKDLYSLVGEDIPRVDLRFAPSVDFETVGGVVRDFLGIEWETQIKWAGPHAALGGWREAVEAAGSLVFQAGGIALEEMRGTCLPEEPLPVIILNSKDSPLGRVFSLLHEFVHVAFWNAGHFTSASESARRPELQKLEVAANAIAASALLPAEGFLEIAKKYPRAEEGDDNQLRLLSQYVGVSPEAVLRRFVSLQEAPRQLYRSKRREWGDKLWYARPNTGGGPMQHIKTIAGNGRSFTGLVMTAYDQRRISSSAASDYLGVRPKHFQNIRLELSGRPLRSA